MPNLTSLPAYAASASPDYSGLVKFLVETLLETPESLSVDCEQIRHNRRIWVRVAIGGNDKGKVYGRGGRNLQAIRTVLETAATAAGQSLHIEIYEGQEEFRPEPPRRRPSLSNDRERDERERRPPTNRKQRSRRPAPPRF